MSNSKILIVEDNPIVAEDIRVKLGHMGHEVVAVATTGEEAVVAADQKRPDLALMDIRLGSGMSGIEAAGKIKSRHSIPIIYLTAFADEETLAEAKRTEPYGYIVKPFDDNDLRSVIEIALYKQKSDRLVRENRRWLETTLKSIGDGVIATDARGNVAFMNAVAESLTGWEEREALGLQVSTIFQAVNEITGEVEEYPVTGVFQEGVVVGLSNQTLLKSRDGSLLPVADSVAPIRDDLGEIIGAVLVLRDQSKERQAKKALEESERQLSTLMGNLPGMAYRCLNDEHFTMLYLSRGCKELTGYEPSEIIGNHSLAYADLIVQEDQAGVWTTVQGAIGADCPFTLEYRIKDKNGKVKWLWERGICVEDKDSKQVVLEGFISDISERKQAESHVRRLAAAIRQVDESVMITDTRPAIEYVNPAFEKITGYHQHELVGKNPSILQSGNHIKSFYKQMWQTLLDGKVWRGRFHNKRKNGSLFLEDASISPVLDDHGHLSNFVAVKRDVTKEIEIEKQLRQSQKMKAIGTLAGGIAHDFNNILTSILGFTELALDEVDSGSSLDENLQEVYASGKRARDLVRQILDFSRQEEGELKPVQIGLIVNELLKLIRSTTPSTIEIHHNIASRALILGDPTGIHQLVMNLLNNAIAAMDDGGVLSVALEGENLSADFVAGYPELSPGEYIKLTVSDTGCGIPAEFFASIYEPYFTTKNSGDGTGLGLSMVYSIVKQCRGVILVESEPEGGSEFKVYLPVTSQGQQVEGRQLEPLPRGNERVLFVDDEVPIITVGRRNLEALGYRVTALSSSLDALALFRSTPNDFDLVITDMTMPHMTGDILARELLAIRPDIPIILCTGYNFVQREANWLLFKHRHLSRRLTMKSALYSIMLLISIFSQSQAVRAETESATKPSSNSAQILVLNSYQYGLPVPDGFDRGILATLRSSKVSVSDVFIEKLDFSRVTGNEHRTRMAHLLRHKLADKSIDIVIIEGFPAVEFVAEEGSSFIQDSALLITVATPSIAPLLGIPNKVINLPWRVDTVGTLRTAIDLFPKTRRVLVVTGAHDLEMPFLDEAKKNLAPWKEKLEIEFTNSMTYEEMIGRVSATPPGTVIIYSPYFNDRTGRSFVPAEVARTIALIANAPVFTILDTYMGYGFVGGSLLKTEGIGEQAAMVALDYLERRLHPVDPVTTLKMASERMFDWSALDRWNVRLSMLPKDSSIINRRLTLWDQYRNSVIAATSAIIALTALVILLAGQSRRRVVAEARFRVIIDQAPDAIVVYDVKNSRFADANPRAELLFGCSREDLFEKDLFQFYAPDQPDPRADIENLLKAGVEHSLQFELKITSGHGIETLCDVHMALLPSEEGRRVRISFVDITERKRAEQALADEAVRRRVLIEESRDGIMVLDQSGKVYEANQKQAEILGYTREEMLQLHVWDWDTQWTREEILNIIQSVDETGNFFETRHRRKDGSLLDVEVSITGSICGGQKLIFCVCRDITERKRAESERERLIAAIEQTSDIIVITDSDGTIQYVNPAFETVSGYSREEAIGKNPRILQSGQQDDAFYAQMWATISNGKTWGGRLVNKRKDGALYTEEATISPVRDSTGKIVNYVGSKRDITEQLQLENQFQQAQKIESVGRLAGGVAHDFNNMLGVIIGYTEIALTDSSPGTPMHANLTEIYDAARRSSDLTRQLLAFARQQTIAPKVLDLNSTVDGMLKLIHRIIGEDIELVWTPRSDLWHVKMDPTQIDQILANLCVNARDAISVAGKIIIETENISLDETYCANHIGTVPGEYVMLAVSDNGCGMDSEAKKLLFEPFFTTKEIGKGTGLGLSTVYGIVKQNNGFLNVYSELGHGTTFKIYIPRQGEGIIRPQATVAAEHPRDTGKTVLLVEDEPAILKISKRFLEMLGHTVMPAGTPTEAIRQVEEYKGEIHLLMTDVVMPEMNGQELAERLLTKKPGMKCLFMSGYTADVIAHHGVLQEGVQFIPKPFSKKDLATKIRETLASP